MTFIISYLWCLLFQMGKWSNMYLFFRKKLKWTIIEYSRYTTVMGMVGVAAQYLLMPVLSGKLQLKDTTILLVSLRQNRQLTNTGVQYT